MSGKWDWDSWVLLMVTEQSPSRIILVGSTLTDGYECSFSSISTPDAYNPFVDRNVMMKVFTRLIF